jgi:hypothetical protein
MRVLAGEIAKRRRYLTAMSNGELHPQHVGVGFRRSRRNSESVGHLDVRAALRDEVHDLPLPNRESCVAI